MISIHDVSSIHNYQTDKKTWSNDTKRTCHFLAYQVEGCYEHNFKDDTLMVEKNTMFFINKNDLYTVRALKHGYAICIAFYGDIDFKSAILNCSDNPHAYNLFKKLLLLRRLDLESARCVAISILYELFSLFFQKKENVYTTSSVKGKMEKVKNYILLNYRDKTFESKELASLCGVGVKRFRELFKQHYKTTPAQYVINLRLNAAARLLTDGGLSVSKVAESVGFLDVYYFSKLFKKRFSCSPTQFKNQPQ